MREHKRAEIAHAKCERGRQLVCDAFQCYEFHFIALLLFDRHPIQAGAGCSQKKKYLGWYVTSGVRHGGGRRTLRFTSARIGFLGPT